MTDAHRPDPVPDFAAAPSGGSDQPMEREPEFVARLLSTSGRPDDIVAAMIALDRDIFHWRRSLMKGEGLAAMLKSAGLGLELAEFQALLTVHRLNLRARAEGGEGAVTVGALAQDMGLDPSRASRLATKLIAGGYLRRGVAQSDARKAVLEVTELGAATLDTGRRHKWNRYVEAFKGWSDAEIAAFATLLNRYVTTTRRLNGVEQGPPATPES